MFGHKAMIRRADDAFSIAQIDLDYFGLLLRQSNVFERSGIAIRTVKHDIMAVGKVLDLD